MQIAFVYTAHGYAADPFNFNIVLSWRVRDVVAQQQTNQRTTDVRNERARRDLPQKHRAFGGYFRTYCNPTLATMVEYPGEWVPT